MRKPTTVTLALGAALVVASFAAVPAEAKITSNGASLNGRMFNGLSFNGRNFNGKYLNGFRINGIRFNGTGDVVGTGALSVRVVRLPDGRALAVRQR